jgi:predicted nuclease of predicted toxin-antitoxin system
MSRSSDADIMATALAEDRIVISSDTDFGELLAKTNAAASG